MKYEEAFAIVDNIDCDTQSLYCELIYSGMMQRDVISELPISCTQAAALALVYFAGRLPQNEQPWRHTQGPECVTLEPQLEGDDYTRYLQIRHIRHTHSGLPAKELHSKLHPKNRKKEKTIMHILDYGERLPRTRIDKNPDVDFSAIRFSFRNNMRNKTS